MWFWYALAAAIVSAISILLNKNILGKVNSPVLTWALFALSLPLFLVLGLKDGLPGTTPLFWTAVIISSFLFVFSKSMVNTSFQKGTLSKIVPLTAFSTFFSYILGLVFLSEAITLIPLFGLLLIMIGAYILNVEQAHEGLLKPFAILLSESVFLFYLLAMFLASIATLLDKVGVLNTTPYNPSFLLLVENIIMSVVLFGYMIKTEKSWQKDVKKHFWMLLLNSLVYAGVTILVVTSFIDGPLALANGIKRLEVVFVLLFGAIFLHDKPAKSTLLGAFLMVLGAICIRIG